jgi:hypothetical protein
MDPLEIEIAIEAERVRIMQDQVSDYAAAAKSLRSIFEDEVCEIQTRFVFMFLSCNPRIRHNQARDPPICHRLGVCLNLQ